MELLLTLQLLAKTPNKLCLITSNDHHSSSQLYLRGLPATDEEDAIITISASANIAFVL